MKKTYLQPTLQVVHVNVTSIIAVSGEPDVGLNSDRTIDAGNIEVKGHGLGKTVWDDQW